MGVSDIQRDRIGSFLADWMEREGAPGVSVTVIDVDDDDVYMRGFGSRNLKRNDPATVDTLYGIASCTKSFTATAILQLAEQGILDVHDPISDHLSFTIWEDADPPITIHDLLTHSSGLPGDGSAFLLLSRELGLSTDTTPLGTVDDLRRFTEGSLAERAAVSGDSFFYHNTGYTLLGEVVAHRSGMPFHEYVRDKILEPLNMTRSTFQRAQFGATEDTLTPYLLTEDGPQESEFPFDDVIRAAGGLLSSVSDLAKYLRFQLQDGEVNGTRLLSEESIAKMRDGYVDWDYAMSGSNGEYGYAWLRREFMGERVHSHIGDIVVSSAYVGFIPERDLGVAVLANTSPEYIMQSVGEGVLSILLGGTPAADVPFWGVRKKFDRLTGRYESYRGVLTGRVEQAGHTLRFESDGGPAMSFQLVPETTERDDFTFYTFAKEGYRKPLQVDVDGDDVDIYLGRWQLHKVAE